MSWSPAGNIKGPQGDPGSDADVTEHEADTNPHPQYLTETEGDGLYMPLSVKPFPPVDLTSATSIAINASLGTHFRVAAVHNIIFAAPNNPTDGQVITVEFTATSSNRTMSFDTSTGGFKFGDSIAADDIVTTQINTCDIVQAVYHESSDRWRIIGYVGGF